MGMSMGMAIFPIPMMPMIFPFILEGKHGKLRPAHLQCDALE
jgi:hypothetical protein